MSRSPDPSGKELDQNKDNVYYTHVKSADVIKILRKDGWVIHNVRGSHHQFKHPTKTGKVTVPHPESELPIGTIKSILKQAGINLEEKK